MKPGQTCSTCSAFAPLAKQCRAKSPLAVPLSQDGKLVAVGIWPAAEGGNWCREWMPDNTPLS